MRRVSIRGGDVSSNQIQPERSSFPQRRSTAKRRAWAKRDFDFWHRCTIEDESNEGITVSFDNLDEATVGHDCVREIELEQGDIVFLQHWQEAPGGSTMVVKSVNREVITSNFFNPYERDKIEEDPKTCFLREVRLYYDLPEISWEKGAKVFAYKPVHFVPDLFLMFPATVQAVHHGVCVEVIFEDGGLHLVPITLVQDFDVNPGDAVHTCTTYLSHGTNPSEQWGPCRVVDRVGERLVLQADAHAPFETQIDMVAILPTGYRMNEKHLLEKITAPPAAAAEISLADLAAWREVHIVRTERWQDAAKHPITKAHIEAVLAKDASLSWSTDNRIVASRDAGRVKQSIAIAWNGHACFWWNQNKIACTNPDPEQLAKMIEIAIALDANVIGDAGEEYH